MSELEGLQGFGPRRVALMAKLGLHNLRDLLYYFPRAYQDRTHVVTLSQAQPDTAVCLRGTIVKPLREWRKTPGRLMITTRAGDGTGFFSLCFFNAPYVRETLIPGQTYLFFGKPTKNDYGWEMVNPLFEPEGQNRVTGRIMPIYSLTAGLSQAVLRGGTEQALARAGPELTEPLPEALRAAHRLCHIDFALRQIHYPDDFETLALARRRLVFEELLLLTLGLTRLRRGRQTSGLPMPLTETEGFEKSLPFALTGDQKKAIGTAAADMASGRPMHRLLQGDVGSGKTAAAAGLAYVAAANGYQSALMAPTEILAVQHAATLSALLPDLNVLLYTGRMPAKERKRVARLAAAGEAHVLVGTHALLSESLQFAKLGLVVTDEQHRFGVDQRAMLTQKAERPPHVLVMSATPIPRTLALVLYGDLDVSVIKEKPAGRQPVGTFVVDERLRKRMEGFVRKLAGEGRQIYVVCPRVENDEFEENALKSARQVAKELQEKIFPDLRVGLLHGKSKDKDAVMDAFTRHELDILVATTVIEVGVDLPNAALMIVENADRFGLSQLHQLRGRVGRGAWQSYCLLLCGEGAEAAERLKVLTRTQDGFEIADQDLKLRGPGDFFGERQHGLPALRVADLTTDRDIFDEARETALALLAEDPELNKEEHRALRQAVSALMAHL